MVPLLAALLFSFPDPFLYKIKLADGSQTTARVFLPKGNESSVRVESADTRSTWQPSAVSTATASVTGRLTRWEALPLKGGWLLQKPLGGALPLDGPLLTFHDMRLFIGKRYDELRAAPKRFLQLGYASERPGLDQVELSPAGTEVLVVGNQKVIARRLRYKTKLWLNGQTQTGTIAVGPSGELLRADPPFVSTPLRAASLLTKTPSGALVLTYKEPAYSLRAEPTDSGYSIKTIVDGHALVGLVSTDASGKPQRIQNDWPGKPFVGTVAEGELAWTLDSPALSRSVFPDESDLVLFPPQLFSTVEWEKAFSAPGEVHPAVFLLFHEGFPEEVELERLPDPRAGVHRYRLRGEQLRADIMTDGTLLLLLRFADGAEIVGLGGDELRSVPGLAWP